jgi:NAD(P)-dependent dehydrogenase (short-subunit alcohol dehydrogenase family)
VADIRIPESFPRPGDVRGARVVITGGSRGLGRLLVQAFADAGARVVAVARNKPDLDRLVEEVDGEVIASPGDVTDPDDNERACAVARDEWGGLDVWIGNAGISPVVRSSDGVTSDTWNQVLDVNLTGVFYGVRAAVPVLRDGGRIIVTTSVLGERPRGDLAPYSASKAGVVGLVRALAVDLAPRGITVNAVAPGWFDSPLASGWMNNPRLEEKILGHTALGRWGRSEDLPGAYLFLASEAAAYITGTVLPVDGGYLAV